MSELIRTKIIHSTAQLAVSAVSCCSQPTDLILYSERVPLPVQRAIHSQSPHLGPLLTSLSCCQGRYNHQEPLTLLLPDVPYRLLLTAVTFLYTGTILVRQQDRDAVMVL